MVLAKSQSSHHHSKFHHNSTLHGYAKDFFNADASVSQNKAKQDESNTLAGKLTYAEQRVQYKPLSGENYYHFLHAYDILCALRIRVIFGADGAAALGAVGAAGTGVGEGGMFLDNTDIRETL
jgi:hypothetical protein